MLPLVANESHTLFVSRLRQLALSRNVAATTRWAQERCRDPKSQHSPARGDQARSQGFLREYRLNSLIHKGICVTSGTV